MASETQSNPRPVLGATRARQGRSGRHIVWVLVFGTLLTVLAFIVALAWNSDDVNVNDGKDNAAATAFDAPPSQPIQTPAQELPAVAPQAPAPSQ